MGYHHPSGEVHVMDHNQWYSCPGNMKFQFQNEEKEKLTNYLTGQDNTCKVCSVGHVLDIFDGNATDHVGPFDSVIMGVGC